MKIKKNIYNTYIDIGISRAILMPVWELICSMRMNFLQYNTARILFYLLFVPVTVL